MHIAGSAITSASRRRCTPGRCRPSADRCLRPADHSCPQAALDRRRAPGAANHISARPAASTTRCRGPAAAGVRAAIRRRRASRAGHQTVTSRRRSILEYHWIGRTSSKGSFRRDLKMISTPMPCACGASRGRDDRHPPLTTSSRHGTSARITSWMRSSAWRSRM